MATPASASELAGLLREVRRVEVQGRRLADGMLAGNYRSVFRGSGVEFDEVREYVPGDPRRSMDWGVTARTGRPHVRKYVDERERTLLLMLDLSASMDAGEAAWTPRQFAARVCATLAMAAVRNNDRVGLLAFSDRVEHFLAPRKGRRHLLALLRDCLSLEAISPRTDLAPALDFANHALHRHATVFVVSDFLDAGEWGHGLAVCARHHDLVAARLLATDAGGVSEGLQRVRGAEGGRRRLLDGGSPAVRRALIEDGVRRDRDFGEALRRAAVDRIDLPLPREADSRAVADPLRRFFAMRTARGGRR